MILHGSWYDGVNDTPGGFVLWGEIEDSLKTQMTMMEPEAIRSQIRFFDEAPSAAVQLIYPSTSEDMQRDKAYGIYVARGISLSPAAVFRLGLSLSATWDGDHRITIAPDLQFWISCIRLTAELLNHHKYLPAIQKAKDGQALYGKWQLYIRHHGDMERVKRLIRAMPPLCRASFAHDADMNVPKVPDSKIRLLAFMQWLADGVIRQIPFNPWDLVMGVMEGFEANQWREALGKSTNLIHGTREQIKKIISGYNTWISPLNEDMTARGFRICFRIHPPKHEQDAWLLEYLLQSYDDPSLLLPAKQVWQETGDVLTYLNYKFQRPHEHLLMALGEASRLFPPITRSLHQAAPSDCLLQLEEAYLFLQEGALVLEESGFGVLAPTWWKRPTPLKVNVKRKADSSKVSTGNPRFGLDTIMHFDWQVALGDSELTKEEFEQLAKLKVPLIQIRGQWMEFKASQLTGLFSLWKKYRDGMEMPIGEVLRLSLGGEGLVPGMSTQLIEQEENTGDFIEALMHQESLNVLPCPQGFSGRLRPYQERGFSWMAYLRQHNVGACLADDMGLGKTIQLIGLLLHEREMKWTDKPTLLICPTSVVGNWYKELAKFAPGLKAHIHHGPFRYLGEDLLKQAMACDVMITTYSLVARDEVHMAQIEWCGIVLDEAQNIKSTNTKQTQAVKRLRQGYRIAMTGTPVENRLSEIWSIMEFLNPGYLGNWSQFRRNYAIPIEKEKNRGAQERLSALLSPFILRRLKTDPTIIKDLPDKIETKVYCSLTREQATLYEAVVSDMLTQIESSEGIERKGMVLSALIKLKQICNHPAHFLKDGSSLLRRSGKLERMLELLEEITAKGERSLIFTQFAEMGKLLCDVLSEHLNIRPLYLHGGVSRQHREEMVEAFQQDGRSPGIFVLSLKAGGVGLNLTKANHVFHFDRWWNPAVENQATDRAFRIGQTKNVEVHKFICLGTIEERIDEMLEEKQQLADSIIGTGEHWITELDNDQLRTLFKLNTHDVLDEEEV